MIAALPDRPNRVDHIARRQIVAAGELSLARRAAAQRAAFCQKLRSSCAMDRPVHTTAAKQRIFRRVDDRVHSKPRDIRLFQNKTRQYIFISSASAYQKPLTDYRITESTPLVNPYWQYSRNKIEAEEVLMSAYRTSGFPVTIVRPSHTYNGTKPPVAVHGDKGNWQILKRILDGKPVIIPGDGSSLWTLTHSKDFAKGYVGLMANPHAIGNAFHITTDESMTWNQIYQTIADALGKPLNALHVASDFLAKHSDHYDFRGELLGDKAATVVFDNSKIKRLVPDFICHISMADGLRQAVHYMLSHPETQTPDPEFDSWCDRIANAISAADKAF